MRRKYVRSNIPKKDIKTIELFNGNIDELLNELSKIPESIKAPLLDFANQPDIKTAEKRILEGDTQLFERYQVQAKKVKFNDHTHKELIYNTEGLFFDVSTYLTGQAEYWIDEIETDMPKAPKDIKINIAAPYWVSENDIFNKLIKIVELIDNAEATGQRLNIKVGLYMYDGNYKQDSYNMEIEIKKDSQPLNIQQLVYVIANPVLLRYAMIATAYNKGLSYNPIARYSEEENEIGNKDFIYIPSISYDHKNNICYTGGLQFNYERLNIEEDYKITI